MDPLVLASYFLKADRQERDRRAQRALDDATIGFRRAMTPPLAAFGAVGMFALALGLLH